MSGPISVRDHILRHRFTRPHTGIDLLRHDVGKAIIDDDLHVGNHQFDQGEPKDFPADEQLRDHRIAETLRVLLFITVSIPVFNFYPLTAVMIVMLALLNDGAILSIAYDNVRYKNEPEAWNMHAVLGISTVLGVVGVISAFALFYLGERVFHLDRAHIQTLMYLKLSVAGHLTIFLTRTRSQSGPYAQRGFCAWLCSVHKYWQQ